MKHIIGIITQALTMAITYVTVMLSLLLDALIFALPILLIYNFTLLTKFSAPELNYLDIAGLIFLIKVFAVLWKSVKVEESSDEFVDNKQQLNEQENG